MQNTSPVRNYRRSPAALQATRVATAALFVALGVALSPFSIPVLGARIFPVQSFLNVLGALFLGPAYTLLVALIVSLIRNATGLGTPLAYMGSMPGALLAALAYWSVMRGTRVDERGTFFPHRMLLATLAAAAGEIIGTGILGAIVDGAVVAPVILHHRIILTLYLLPFLFAAMVGSLVACVVSVVLLKTGIRPRFKEVHV
jgi:energy-coupling factor transport system ATP-binding protein